MRTWKKAVVLFGQFFKFGCFTFGGGWSIIAQMQKLYVENEKTMTSEELLDITSVGRSLPGTMIGNVAMLYGYHVGGVVCGLACLIGMILPPLLILTVITYFYSLVQDNPWVMSAMVGVRAAIVPIIASAAVSLLKSAFRYPLCYALTIMAVILYLAVNMSCVTLVVIGVVCGLLISEYYERKELKKNGTA